MAFTITTRLKNDTGSSSTDRLTGDPTLTGLGAANQVVYFYEATRLIGTTLADATGNWIYTPPLTDGKHSLTVVQKNAAGATASASLSFVLDTAPPPVSAALKAGPVASFSTTSFAMTLAGGTLAGPAVAGPTYIATGDLNHDGAVDLVTLDEGNNVALITLGDGKGGFATTVAVPTGNAPSAVTIADVNGDGFGDLLVTDSADDDVSILINDGRGGFVRTTLAVGANPQAVRAADVTGDGNLDLLVANSGDNNVTLFTGNGKGQFTKGASFAVGLTPDSMAVGDVNGDGKADIVTANMAEGTVSVLLGAGAGKFGPAATFDVGSLPTNVARADVDGDGKMDLLVANSGDGSVTVLRGDGLGGFQPLSVVHFNGAVNGLSVGDVNGDGFVDFAAGGGIAYGDGTGHFVVNTSNGFGALVDVNGDGKLDVLRAGSVSINTTTGPRNGFISDPTLTGSGDPRATVHFLEGGKEIGKTVATSTGTWSFKPALADGKHDITVQETDATGNTGSAHVIFTLDTVAPTPTAILAHDNGASARDGLTNDPTISGKGDSGDTIQLYEGTVLLGSTTVAANGTWSVTPALADGTHKLLAKETDAAGNIASSGTVSFSLDQTAPNVSVSLAPSTTLAFAPPVSFDSGLSFPSWIGSADLNGDGKIDIISATNTTFAVQLGDGTGGLGSATISPGTAAGFASGYALADVNGDGKADVVSSYFDGTSTIEDIFINDGTGKFAAPMLVTLPSAVTNIAIADLNGDKKADLISVGGQITVQLGDGTGKFGAAVTSASGMAYSAPLIFDANGDGLADVATFGTSFNGISSITGITVSLNAGGGKFGAVSNLALGFTPSKLLTGDIDGDGKSDLVALGLLGGSYVAAVLLGDGTGKFGPATTSTVGSNILGAAIADVNGDGRGDLIFGSGSDATLSVKLSDGTGKFGAATTFGTSTIPSGLAIADLNGDGKADLITATSFPVLNGFTSTSPLSVMLNTTSGPFGNVVKAPVLRGLGEVGQTVSVFEGIKLLGTTLPDASGAWTFTPTLTDGTHVLQVQQTDAAGNVGTRPLTITVKTHAGAVTAVLSNDTGALSTDGVTADPTIKGTGAIGETISVSEGTTVLGTTVVDKTGAWSFKPVLGDGAHKLSFTAGDAAGNAGVPATVSFTLDTAPPAVTIVPPATIFHLAAAVNSDTGISSFGNNITAVADLDGDGKIDALVTGGTSFSIMKGDGTGAFTKLSTVNVGTLNGSSYILADVNGDGKPDVVATSFGSTGLFANIFLNTGGGQFSTPTAVSVNSQQMAAADLNGDGKADLVGQSGSTLNVMLNDGTGKFAAPTSYSIAGGGAGSAITPLLIDVNGDGRLDIVTAGSSLVNSVLVYSVSVLINDGTGKFIPGTSRVLSSGVSQIFAADVNGDGKADIIVTGGTISDNIVTVLSGDGAGGFGRSVVTSLGAALPTVGVGDVNGDGRADLVVQGSDGSVSLMTSDGSGKFSSPVSYGSASSGGSIAISDVNNDGKLDILTNSTGTFNGSTFTYPLSVLLNTTTGAFGNMVKAPVLTGTAEAGLTVSIFEGSKLLGSTTPGPKGAWSFTPVLADGKHTLVIKQTDAAGNLGSSTLTLLVKTTSSTLTALLANDTGKLSTDGITSDSSLTGKGGAGDTISVFEGTTAVATTTVNIGGTWTIKPTLADGVHTLTIKDTDGAGNVSTPLTVRMTLDTTAPSLSLNPLTTLGFAAPVTAGIDTSFPDWLAAADLDGDGNSDVITASQGAVSILAGTGKAALGAVRTFTEAAGPFGFAPVRTILADMNGDGKLDLAGVYSGNLSASVIIYINDGKGNFGTGTTAVLPTASTSVAAADLNGDGKADLVSISNGQAYVQTNEGPATFNGFTKFSLGVGGGAASDAILADLNGDNRPDIIAFGASMSGVVTLMNDGTGKFGAASALFPTAAGLSQVLSADINGDGNLDIVGVVPSFFSGGISSIVTMLGDGTGKFAAPVVTNITTTSASISAITDVNGDNRPDIVFAPDSTGKIPVRLGDGAGGFGAETTYAAGNGVSQVIAADINGDGKPDIVVTNNAGFAGQVGVLMNTTTGPFGYVVASPTLSGKGDPGVITSIFEGTSLLGSVSPDALGGWSFKPVLAAGTHTLTVKQTDIAGNTTTASLSLTVPGVGSLVAAVPVSAAPKLIPVIQITGGGNVTLDPGLTGVTVQLSKATNLTLNKMSFITAIGSTGADTITAQAANQTLTGGAGADTLAGFSGFGTTFKDSSSGLNGDQIKLFGGTDKIDLTDLVAKSAKPLTYKGNATSGVLTASDGLHTANITFVGSYSVLDFQLSSDGAAGSLVAFVRH
jgi:Bacterial Ig-like domain/FG-GAP-like repeat